ncbi:MAG: hypothetical protein AABY32_06300 [Nanoarchaeota archaeon]
MIEYKLIGKNNRPVTIYNLEETNKSIGDIFPEIDTNKMSAGIRKTHGTNGEIFHIYYGERGSRIFLPREYEELIRERLEIIAELKFGEIKCQ